jgi:hypothetical protein
MTKICTAEEAVAYGYAEFNRNPHLCVDVPDGSFTITAKTSEGKRITFSFLPYKHDGPAKCVDIQYHDSGHTHFKNGIHIPEFDAVLFGETGKKHVPIQLDTRKQPHKPSIVCVLMDNKEELA